MVKEKPNVLFITTDHQRADSLGMVQAGIEVTPNLNRLALEGANFSRAYSTCPLCIPARTALATGKYPTRTGIYYNDGKGIRAQDHKPIHQFLAEAGYEIGHSGIHHIRLNPSLEERVNFSKWVDRSSFDYNYKGRGCATKEMAASAYRMPFRKEVEDLQNGKYVKVKYSNTKIGVWPFPQEWFIDNYFCRESIEFLKRRRSDPFALFVNLWAPHPPLIVPEPYASLFDPDKIDLPANVGIPAKDEPAGRRRSVAAQLAEGLTIEQWGKVWAAHLGLVNLADTIIGQIIQALKDSGQYDNTIILFMSDHGDHLGQHCMYQKMEMYEQAIKIPMVIRIPAAAPQSVDSLVSHIDVMPTLLELLGIAGPDDLDGISLAESILSGAVVTDRPVFSQYSGNANLGNIRRAVITKRYKYVYDPSDTAELYDLQDDPLEMKNLAVDNSHKDIVRELHKQCESWASTHDDWVSFSACRD
ncbi:MAG: sulfatase-like hydrolase/transferase [Planctomycetota bacterium]